MRFAIPLLAASSFLAPSALAGDTILYDAVPEWVEQAEIDKSANTSSSPVVLFDQQARIEDGQLITYVETALALDTPQALTQFGTLSAGWLPDKGDLTIHRAELLRGDEVINLLSGTEKFEVLRREQQLENRMLDGALTATMPVSGAQIGDTLRLAYSTTLRDQALSNEVQWQSGLPVEPAPIGKGRIAISWPKDLPVSRVRLGDADVAEPQERDDSVIWSVDVPVAKPADKPEDAPMRYLAGELMQVSTYPDWRAVSSRMAPLYSIKGAITAGGDLEEQITQISEATSDKRERATMALRLVQDRVSYLLNGLNGGNYLPQSPKETWEKRFGDCKAKSVLLLAMLDRLGVAAEIVLVRSNGGDTLPMLAPMPGNFDHMIVRADIDGTVYWLDGTIVGTRADTLDVVPRFHYALPLRNEGADLIALDERPQTSPGTEVQITMDQSAGIHLPALVNIKASYRGVLGGAWGSVAEQSDLETIEDTVETTLATFLGETLFVDTDLTYDEDAGVAILSGRGIQATRWTRDRQIYRFEAPAQAAKNVGFTADRARAAWRDIPLRLNGPIYYTSSFELLLPVEDGQFEIDGTEQLSEVIGSVELASALEHTGNRVSLTQSLRSLTNELPAADISTAKRELNRFDRALPVVKSPENARRAWQYFGDDRKLLEPLGDAYAKVIADAKSDDAQQLVNRARFRAGTYNYGGALEDVEAAMAIEASRDLYVFRASLRRQQGDLQGALSDYELAEDLQPDGSTYEVQIELLALLDRSEDALSLAEDFRGLANDPVAEDTVMAFAMGWAGQINEGQQLIKDRLATRPGDGRLLNQYCWYSSIWDRVDDTVLESCVDAVENSDYSAAALDSRALAHLRSGDLDAAMTDIDAALLAEPSLTEARLLRGIIRLAKGDRTGQSDVDLALAMRPELKQTYQAWGLEF
ncbi:MAG: DUF3857 domain-containing protein [Pseudomonadota bacterium]